MVCVAVLSRGVVAGALPLPVEGSRQVPATFISQVLITDIVSNISLTISDWDPDLLNGIPPGSGSHGKCKTGFSRQKSAKISQKVLKTGIHTII